MRNVRIIAIGLVAVQTALLGWMARVHSPVLDELPHLASGISHWEHGTFDLYRVNPPLVRMVAALPVLAVGVETDWMGGWSEDPFSRPEFPLGRRLADVNGERVFWLFTIARWACLPFAWLGGCICYRWARELYGDVAGLASLGLWVVCPNVLVWGTTICPDLAAAATGLAAAYCYWRWLDRPGWGAAIVAGLSLGLALLTKSTWVVLLGLWPSLWVMRRVGTRIRTTSGLVGLAGVLVLGLYFVHVGYGFVGSLRPLGEFSFISRSLSGHEEHGEPGNRFVGTLFEAIPSPLPADYLLGIDVQRFDFEKGKWSYLRGEQRFGGWWWYYLYALGVKTPVGTLLLLLAAALTCWQRRGRALGRDELVLLAPVIVVIVLVSSQTGFNRYLRYVLPALPFLFVWMSRFVASVPRAFLEAADSPDGLRSQASGQASPARWRVAVMLTCLVASGISSLSVWPHSMAYFNRLAGGPEEGHRHLLDANLDWGQGLLTLRSWLAEHPDKQPLFVSDFGWVDLEQAGIEAQRVPQLLWNADGRLIEGDLASVVPGWYVASVNHVLGYRHYETSQPALTWLQEFDPVARPGYCNWVYRLTESDVSDFVSRHQEQGRPE